MGPVFAVEAVNSVLLLALLWIYIQNYRQMKSAFGLGLIVFAAVLLLQNLVAAYFQFSMIDYYSPELVHAALIISAVQTVALAVLLWVTMRE